MRTRFTFVGAAAGVAVCLSAYGQDYSNTLGDPGFSGSYVSGFAVHDDGSGESLYATGSFTATGVAGTSLIARWDGMGWNSVGGGLQNQYCNVLASFGGDLYAAGYFDTAGGVAGTAKIARFDGTAWNPMDAQLELFLNSIWDMEVFDDGSGDALIVAGNYMAIGGNAGLDHLAKWDGSSFSSIGTSIGGAVPLIVLDVLGADLGSGNTLFAGGRFLSIDGVAANNIAQWDGTTWTAMGDGVDRTSGFAQLFHMVAFDDGSGMALYAGGSFNLINGNEPVNNMAKWDGTTWSPVGDGFNSAVRGLQVFDDGTGEALYAMGNFTSSGATAVSHIAKWSGTEWKAVGAGFDDNAFRAIVFDAGEGEAMHIGGSFANADGMSSNRIVSLLSSASCIADLNGDGNTDFLDISAFISGYGGMDPSVDFNGDGNWDFLDISAFLASYSSGCP